LNIHNYIITKIKLSGNYIIAKFALTIQKPVYRKLIVPFVRPGMFGAYQSFTRSLLYSIFPEICIHKSKN